MHLKQYQAYLNCKSHSLHISGKTVKKCGCRSGLKKYLRDETFDGLLLDLRLDGGGPNQRDFTATTLAQDIRTLAASDDKVDADVVPFPIVLCSTSPNMRSTYDIDKTSHDLFDYKFEKSKTPNWKKFSKKIKSLGISYSKLRSIGKDLNSILGRDDWRKFDSRIFEKFVDEEQKMNENDIAQFVIKELFHHPGILIKERTLAARLGVDIDASGDEWTRLKDEQLAECKYSGVFHCGWDRWWFDKISDEFQVLSEEKKIQNLNAEERVEIINKSGYSLIAAKQELAHCSSTEFWTICEYYKKPLDTLEGFKIYESVDLKPWQEPKYLSFDAALHRKGLDQGLRPHPSEKQNIKDLKEMLS